MSKTMMNRRVSIEVFMWEDSPLFNKTDRELMHLLAKFFGPESSVHAHTVSTIGIEVADE